MTEPVTLKKLAEILNSAVALHREGKKAAAKEKYEEILFHEKQFPGLNKNPGGNLPNQATVAKNIFSQTYNNLGVFLEEENLWGQSLGYFRKALTLSRGNVEALTNMSRVFSKQLNLEGAFNAAKEAVALNPTYVPAVIQLCRVCYKFGHIDMALKAVEKVKADLSTNVSLIIEFSRLLEKAGRYEEARKNLERAVKLNPKSVFALLNLANVNFKLNRLDRAFSNYQSILELNPKSVPALSGLGFLLQNMGQFGEALECYKRALAVNQGHHETLAFYASLLSQMGKTKEALEMTDRLFKMSKIPERAILTGGLTRAACLRKMGRVEDSIVTLKEIKPYAKEPFFKTNVHFGFGCSYDLLKKPGEAFREFKKANQNFLEANTALVKRGGGFENLLDRLLAKDFSNSFPKKTALGKTKTGPVFLVGPVLGGNIALGDLMALAPKISVYSDTHVIEGIRQQLEKTESGYPGSLATLGAEECAHLLSLFEEVNQKSVFKGEKGQTIEVDAMHIINVPFILKLFPNAKFIFVGCDPRDSVLNTFMNGFIATPITVNYSDLGKITRLYGKTMDLWQKYQKEIPFEALNLKYEDLMKNPEKEINKVLTFIGYKNSKEAKKALNGDAFFNKVADLESQYPPGRWKNYKIHLEKVLPVLKPYCKDQGYPV